MKRLKVEEMVEPQLSIRLALTSAMTRKELENAVRVLKCVSVKVFREEVVEQWSF